MFIKSKSLGNRDSTEVIDFPALCTVVIFFFFFFFF